PQSLEPNCQQPSPMTDTLAPSTSTKRMPPMLPPTASTPPPRTRRLEDRESHTALGPSVVRPRCARSVLQSLLVARCSVCALWAAPQEVAVGAGTAAFFAGLSLAMTGGS